ncbi:hypothetical protein BT63DRAFT_418461 [Microthyrium microscopicum]|uniref:1,3-beta-glucanosyltransferase n=1 Tax=Microthyrium microscopicum TaxID=703497 RepID=A0A6A6TYE3_9PEZI|nr:hypothetical protein BT63DRAFT_418461 [Microthyrium microscopicum]
MKFLFWSAFLLLLVNLVASLVVREMRVHSLLRRESSFSKTPPVTVKGNAFFTGEKRFYIRGMDYQPGGPSDLTDAIADPALCSRDISKFRALGISTIRIYTVGNSKSHDECMRLLAEAGI